HPASANGNEALVLSGCAARSQQGNHRRRQSIAKQSMSFHLYASCLGTNHGSRSRPPPPCRKVGPDAIPTELQKDITGGTLPAARAGTSIGRPESPVKLPGPPLPDACRIMQES